MRWPSDSRRKARLIVIAEIDAQRGSAAAERLGAHFVRTDVRDHESVRRAVDVAVARHGRIDVWINNAGVAHKAPAVDLDVAGWEADIGVMLSGTFYCAKYAGQVMIAQGSGCMVNVSSVNGLFAQKARAGYCSAKAGINMLTKVLASEWGEHGIRVNAVAPGVVMTDLVQEGIDQGIVTEEQYRGRIPYGATGRAGRRGGSRAFPGERRSLLHHWRGYARRWRLDRLSPLLSIRRSVLAD